MIRSAAYIAAGGALGALSRYAVAVAAQRLAGPRFPWGTLSANLMGCFLIGLAWSLAMERSVISSTGRLFLMVGFLGAFTTFSTYALELLNLVREGEPGLALISFLANNLAGAALVVAGAWIGKVLYG